MPGDDLRPHWGLQNKCSGFWSRKRGCWPRPRSMTSGLVSPLILSPQDAQAPAHLPRASCTNVPPPQEASVSLVSSPSSHRPAATKRSLSLEGLDRDSCPALNGVAPLLQAPFPGLGSATLKTNSFPSPNRLASHFSQWCSSQAQTPWHRPPVPPSPPVHILVSLLPFKSPLPRTLHSAARRAFLGSGD